jgi:hypothetical protein
VLASLLARDNYLPHLFSLRDDRQVFASGIWTLAVLSGVLLIVVRGNTLELIPLYAIGVFTGFTLSQSGLVVHWRRTRPPHWRQRAIVNGTGAVVTAAATVIFLITKFTEGAWVVVLAIPTFIFMFTKIHRYYLLAGRALGLSGVSGKPAAKPTIVVVPVTHVSRLVQHALSEALSVSDQVIAVTVVTDDADQGSGPAPEIQQKWDAWNPGPPLRVLHTEYASMAGPLLAFIDQLRDQHTEQVMVLIPVAVPDRLRYLFLHNHFEVVLVRALRSRPDVVVAIAPLPFHVPTRKAK